MSRLDSAPLGGVSNQNQWTAQNQIKGEEDGLRATRFFDCDSNRRGARAVRRQLLFRDNLIAADVISSVQETCFLRRNRNVLAANGKRSRAPARTVVGSGTGAP